MRVSETVNSNEDLENLNKTCNSSMEGDDNYLKKCIRKGEMIYYKKRENSNKTIDQNTKQKRCSNNKYLEGSSSEKLSGESTYKTYIFEENENSDEELEKCIAFWKSVMEKNLKPIKCTIIDNKKSKDKVNIELPKEESNFEEINAAVEQTKVSIHAEYKNMLMKAMNDMRNLKLESVKLIGKARCKLCESVEKPLEEYNMEQDSEAIKKELENLNTWEPISTRKRIGTKDEKHRRKQKESNVCEGKDKPVEKVEYKFVNIIDKKKRNGFYCKWRDNLVKTACRCGKRRCECNTNPAIKSIKRIQGPSCDLDEDTKKADKVPVGEKRKREQLVNLLVEDKEKPSESLFVKLDKPLFDEESRMITLPIEKTGTQATIVPIRDFQHEEITVKAPSKQTEAPSAILPKRDFQHEEITVDVSLQPTDTPASILPIRDMKDEEIIVNAPLQQTDIPSAILPLRDVEHEEMVPLQQTDTPAATIKESEHAEIKTSEQVAEDEKASNEYSAESNDSSDVSYYIKNYNEERPSISIPIDRTVSVILPTGEIEIIRRQSVDNTDWVKPVLPASAVSLDRTRCSVEAIREKFGKLCPKDSLEKRLRPGSKMLKGMKSKSADQVYRERSVLGRNTSKKKVETFAKTPAQPSTQLEILHRKSSDPYQVSTVFMIPQ